MVKSLITSATLSTIPAKPFSCVSTDEGSKNNCRTPSIKRRAVSGVCTRAVMLSICVCCSSEDIARLFSSISTMLLESRTSSSTPPKIARSLTVCQIPPCMTAPAESQKPTLSSHSSAMLSCGPPVAKNIIPSKMAVFAATASRPPPSVFRTTSQNCSKPSSPAYACTIIKGVFKVQFSMVRPLSSKTTS